MKKSMDKGGSVEAFFLFQLFCTAFVVACMNLRSVKNASCDVTVITMALIAGFSLGLMKWMIGKALKKGPAGLTFAALNSASLVPSLVLFLFFQSWVVCEYTPFHFLGSILIAVGLFWAGWKLPSTERKQQWIWWTVCAYLFHLLFLLVNEWRRILIHQCYARVNFLFYFTPYANSTWFGPLVFLTASFLHCAVFLLKGHRRPTIREVIWGLIGGGCNGLSGYFFIKGTEIAALHEASLLFPAFTIALIIGCNIWSWQFYRERVHWMAASLCVIGLLIGSLVQSNDPRQSMLAYKETKQEAKESRKETF